MSIATSWLPRHAGDGAILDASGGVGGDGGPNVATEIDPGIRRRQFGSGGGGSGGRIAIYASADLGAAGKNQVEKTPPKGVLLAGGMAKDGADRTFIDGTVPAPK